MATESNEDFPGDKTIVPRLMEDAGRLVALESWWKYCTRGSSQAISKGEKERENTFRANLSLGV